MINIGGFVESAAVLAKRSDGDHYPTKFNLCLAALSLLPEREPFYRVLDPGAGTGVWGQAARQLGGPFEYSAIVGVEGRNVPKPDGYNAWVIEDFLSETWADNYDVVMGNPPYGRDHNNRKIPNLAELFIRHSMTALRDGGYLIFLLRSALLSGQGRAGFLHNSRDTNLWQELPPKYTYACSKRPSFKDGGINRKTGRRRVNGTDMTDYSVYIWQKGYECERDKFGNPLWVSGLLEWR